MFQDGKVEPFKKSEPIPEVNNEPVKVVVADSLQDIVFNSGKNGVFLFLSQLSNDMICILFELWLIPNSLIIITIDPLGHHLN